MTTPTWTLPIRCSTVRKIDGVVRKIMLACVGGCGGIFFGFLITPEITLLAYSDTFVFGDVVLFPMCIISSVCMLVSAVIFAIGCVEFVANFPTIECIKDEGEGEE